MNVDGPGLYAFYVSSRPIGFVSGSVANGGAPAGGARRDRHERAVPHRRRRLLDVEMRLAGPTPASDFEDGTLASWTPGGATSVLDEKTSTLFAATKEKRYAFMTTGAGNQGRWKDFFQPVGDGARTKRMPVTGCEGKTITLVLGVSDVGDSIYDSAVAIDGIAFE